VNYRVFGNTLVIRKVLRGKGIKVWWTVRKREIERRRFKMKNEGKEWINDA